MVDRLHGPIELDSPLSTEQLLPLTAAEQIYDTYSARVNGMPGFRQRAFHDARDDFSQTIYDTHYTVDEDHINVVRGLLQALVSSESYKTFSTDLSKYWDTHNLESRLKTHSVAILTNHRAFSDLPIAAGVLCDVRRHDPLAAKRNLMVVARMIPTMEVDIFGTGDYAAVSPLLSLVARQIQTVPKLPKAASDEMIAQRLLWNQEAKAAIEHATGTPGHILLEAGSGTHDEITHTGRRLTMKSVNPETARMLCDERLIVVPMFFSCNSFSPDGLVSAEAKYALLEPRILQNDTDDVSDVMHELAAAGTELLRDEFPLGVRYEEKFKDRAQRAGRFIASHFHSEDDTGGY